MEYFSIDSLKTSPKKLHLEKSMDMSFFASCPLRNAPAGPDKSVHLPLCGSIVKFTLRVCPDLWGTLRPSVKGHAAKKDMSMLK
jgi:hypothetical protein